MPAIEWLNRRIPGFANLSAAEREAIEHFTLLWSLFEARCLAAEASCEKIERMIAQWQDDGRFHDAPFAPALAYFRDRYFQNGLPTRHLAFLNLRGRRDRQQLVEAVLRGDNNDAAAGVIATLIVVYRFRNNLFHGEKWEYQLQGQLDNFEHANAVLMNAIDVHDPMLAP